jgi:methionyl-tRNA formyltransferase
MSKIRILFMGTPDFACTALESLIADEHFEVVGVVTQPDRPAGRKMKLTPSPVKEFAMQKGLRIFSPETVNNPNFLIEIKKLGAESAVVVAFGQLLGDAFLALFPHGAVNLHGSLLPRWRGAAPIQRAIMAGDAETGVALQLVVKKLDAGAILGIRKVALSESDTSANIYPLLAKLGCELLSTEYMDYLKGHLTPVPQDELRVTLAPKIRKAESAIDWNRPAVEIVNLIRGLALGPVPHARTADGSLFKIHRAIAFRSHLDEHPGTVVLVDSDSFIVAAGDRQGVRVLEIQPESRAKMTVSEYLKGYPLQAGDVLLNGLIYGDSK